MENETLARYKWRFHDRALVACANHNPNGGEAAVREVLQATGSDLDSLPLGPGVSLVNAYDLRRLPDGTILTKGDPIETASYGVWVRRDQRTLRVLGTHVAEGRLTIDTMGDIPRPAWLDAEPAEDEERRIEDWKRLAWAVGWKAKQARRWCETFESVMAEFGMYR